MRLCDMSVLSTLEATMRGVYIKNIDSPTVLSGIEFAARPFRVLIRTKNAMILPKGKREFDHRGASSCSQVGYLVRAQLCRPGRA